MNNFLLSGVIRSSEALEKAGEVTTAAGEAGQQAAGGVGFLATPLGMIGYFAVIIALFYFFAIRPQRKKEKQLRSLQDEIKLGDSVLLDSGIYGKVAGISDNIFTIEFGTNKGVLIPVLKQRIVAKAEPDFSNSVE